MPLPPARRIAGWAVRWDSPAPIDTQRYGAFVETIARGAFAEAVDGGRVELWRDHDRRQGVIACQPSGTLLLHQDSVGLWLDANVVDCAHGDDALEDVRGSGFRCGSVGMFDVRDEWSTVDGKPHRLIKSANLREISICRRGAHPTARIAAGRLPIERIAYEGRRARLALAEGRLVSRCGGYLDP